MLITHDYVRTIIFALIPLILSIGIVPVISFAENVVITPVAFLVEVVINSHAFGSNQPAI